MLPLLETLVAELESPRELLAQVVHHLCGTYSIDREKLGPFLIKALPKLEDYEIDLALSPLFTPALQDQAVFAELLGRESVPKSQWPALVRQIVDRPTKAHFVTEDGVTHEVQLQEVSVERYVHRLRLEATIPESLYQLLTSFPAAGDQPILKAVARRLVWEPTGRREILTRYLVSAGGQEGYRLNDLVELLRLAETYQPADVAALLKQIPHWLQVLRQEIDEGGAAKPFFNERVEELHGGGRDHRRRNTSRITAKETEHAFLERLQRVLAI